MPVTNLVTVGPGVGLRTGGAKNHRPFNVFLAQPNSNPVSRSLFLPGNPAAMRVSGFFYSPDSVAPLLHSVCSPVSKPAKMP